MFILHVDLLRIKTPPVPGCSWILRPAALQYFYFSNKHVWRYQLIISLINKYCNFFKNVSALNRFARITRRYKCSAIPTLPHSSTPCITSRRDPRSEQGFLIFAQALVIFIQILDLLHRFLGWRFIIHRLWLLVFCSDGCKLLWSHLILGHVWNQSGHQHWYELMRNIKVTAWQNAVIKTIKIVTLMINLLRMITWLLNDITQPNFSVMTSATA